jgi:hypothetical protein
LAEQSFHQSALATWLTDFYAAIAEGPATPGDLDMADAATVLREAVAIRATRVSSAGAARAATASQQLRAALPAAIGDQPARRALLFITANAATPLEMDELSELTEIIHGTLLHDNGVMILGHRERPPATGDDLQIWLLGY